jgi:hypothetical protein
MRLAFSMPSLRNRFATALLILTSTQSQAFSSQFAQRTKIVVAANSYSPIAAQRSSPLLLTRGGSSALFSTTAPSSPIIIMPAASPEDVAGPKLEALRASLAEKDLDVYLVPSDDPHLSEYTPDAYKRRAFLTGFEGSAGTAVVTKEEALLWTDSR